MNWFNQKSFLENEIRETFAKKASWKLNCCEILPGSGIPNKFLNPVQELSLKKETQTRAHPIWPNIKVPPSPIYSYSELTIENIKEAYIRHFTHQFQLSKNVACSVLATDECTQLDLGRDKMIFCPLFSTRISFFQSFCVQDKTLIHWAHTAVGFSCA